MKRLKRGSCKQRAYSNNALATDLGLVSTGAHQPLSKSTQRAGERKFLSIHAPSCASRYREWLRN